MLSIAAVLTNAGLITFTMDVLDPLDTSMKFWVFIGFQWICFSLQVRQTLYLYIIFINTVLIRRNREACI